MNLHGPIQSKRRNSTYGEVSAAVQRAASNTFFSEKKEPLLDMCM
jgi:hypothetical protein